jgi:site-specific DNA-cytosine methylase
MQVVGWEDPARTVIGASRTRSGAMSVADPRFAAEMQLGENPARYDSKFSVRGWDEPVPTVTSTASPGGGAPSVADPRWGGGRLGVTAWDTGTIAGESLPNNGRFSVADPRPGNKPAWQRVAGVTPWTEPSPVITAGAKIHAGAFQVADPRVALTCSPRAGAYRVLRWEDAAAAITASLAIDNGPAAVADPRLEFDLDHTPDYTPLIIAADGTWHRPLTTLELAALQGFPVTIDDKPLILAGTSHTRWRQAIGNAVPPPAAHAIGGQLLRALLIAKLGAFTLNNSPVWVGPRAVVA